MKKHCIGDKIITLDELMNQEYIYHNNKVQHKGWFSSWMLIYAFQQIQSGKIFYANIIEVQNDTNR